jgi:hypothetical protein
VQTTANRLAPTAPHVSEQIISITGMCVGWGAGDAVVKLLHDLQTVLPTQPEEAAVAVRKVVEVVIGADDKPGGGGGGSGGGGGGAAAASAESSGSGGDASHRLLLSLSDPHAFDQNIGRVAFASAWSLIAYVCIVLMHPRTTSPLATSSIASLAGGRAGDSQLATLAEEFLFCLWGLTTRALTVSVFMAWLNVSSTSLLEGLRPEQMGTPLHYRLLVLWALFLTFAGAAATAQLLRWRQALTDEEIVVDPRPPNQGLSLSKHAPRYYEALREDEEVEEDGGREQKAASGPLPPGGVRVGEDSETGGGGGAADARRSFARMCGVQLILLVEKVVAWIAGCAWTNVVFVTASPVVSGWVTLKDALTAAVLTCLALGWMILVGGPLDLTGKVEGEIERHVVESYFMVQAFSFFVGWSWVVVLRDLAAISGQTKLQPHGFDSALSFLGFESVQKVKEAEESSFVRALVGVIVFGPVLTVLLIWAKGIALRAYTATSDAGTGGGMLSRERLLSLFSLTGSRGLTLPPPAAVFVPRTHHRHHRQMCSFHPPTTHLPCNPLSQVERTPSSSLPSPLASAR